MKKNKNISVGYKDSAVGVIPKEWEVKDFVDIIRISSEKYVPTPKETFKCIELEHIEQQSGRILGWTTSSSQKSTKNKFKKGEVLFGKLRPYLCKFWHAEFEGVCSSEIWVLASKSEKIRNEYLFYLIQSHRFIQKSNASSGTKMPRADWSYISLFPYALPLLKEQKKIAEILSTWDDAIEAQSKLVNKLKLRKQALMQQILTGKRRLKGYNEKSERVAAGDIFKNVSIKGFENEELLSSTQDKGIIPRNMLESRVTMPTNDRKSFKLVENGDFVISLRSFQGGLEYSNYRGIVSPAYTVLKERKAINKEFYKQYFKSYDFIGRLAIAVIGIRDGKQISYDDFCIVPIPNPSIEEQTATANILSTADKEIEIANAKLDKLRQQKKGLMQQLLTGKKRVKIN